MRLSLHCVGGQMWDQPWQKTEVSWSFLSAWQNLLKGEGWRDLWGQGTLPTLLYLLCLPRHRGFSVGTDHNQTQFGSLAVEMKKLVELRLPVGNDEKSHEKERNPFGFLQQFIILMHVSPSDITWDPPTARTALLESPYFSVSFSLPKSMSLKEQM